MIVDVYRNLHKDCYSIRDTASRRVTDYADIVVLGAVTAHVGRKGRERVLREGRKNVHAVLRGIPLVTYRDGELTYVHPSIPESSVDSLLFGNPVRWRKLWYNPRLTPWFVVGDLGPTAYLASAVLARLANPLVHVCGPVVRGDLSALPVRRCDDGIDTVSAVVNSVL